MARRVPAQGPKRRAVIQTGADEPWLTFYHTFRGKTFAGADLDPNEPKKRAEKAWWDYSFPNGVYL